MLKGIKLHSNLLFFYVDNFSPFIAIRFFYAIIKTFKQWGNFE